MKRILLFVLAILLMLLLAACGSTGPQGPQGEQEPQGETGATGPQGPAGITPQLKVGEDNYWYVSYDNGTTWANLNVKAPGADVEQGSQGEQGNDGLSAFEIFKKYYPEYTGSEEEWTYAVATNDVCALFGHKEVTDEAIDSTCEAIGFTEGSHCETCQKVLIAQEVIAKKAHEYGDWEVVCDSTMTEYGIEKRGCYQCGDYETRNIDLKPMITIKELRLNPDAYIDQLVVFEATVTKCDDYAVYVEDYDTITSQYYGFYVYYGFNSSLLPILNTIGNRVRIVGTLSYYATRDVYQISNIQYDLRHPENPGSTQKIGEGYPISCTTVDIEKIYSDIRVIVNDKEKTLKYWELALHTTISTNDLKVVNIYKSTYSDVSSLTCEDTLGNTIIIRVALYDVYSTADLLNKTISVSGIISKYNNSPEINCNAGDIIVLN